jgi:tRNA threonylcarbamoyladenosine biosynthesis protein TsaB
MKDGMLDDVDALLEESVRLLLIDTCAEAAGVALSAGLLVVEVEALTPHGASAEIVAAVRLLLARAGWTLAELDGVGVVSGPGSFTGVRAGLAAAKGFCEATGLPLAAVSRLEVLAEAGSLGGEAGEARGSELAVLDAGRGELYVREQRSGQAAREWVCGVEELRTLAVGRTAAVSESHVAERLDGCVVAMRPLTVADALRPALRRLHDGGSDAAAADANYVRREADIYSRKAPYQTSSVSSASSVNSADASR